MSDAFISVGGQHRRVSDAFVVVGGQYRKIVDGFVSVGGQQRASLSGKQVAVTAWPLSHTPWGKAWITFQANGSQFQTLRIVRKSDYSTLVIKSYTPDSNGDVELDGFTDGPIGPVSDYWYRVDGWDGTKWVYSLDVYYITTASIPPPENPRDYVVTSTSGGIQWNPVVNAYDYYWRNATLSKSGYTAGTKVHNKNLKSGKSYRFTVRARAKKADGTFHNGTNAEHTIKTTSSSYSPGNYYVSPSSSGCWQTGESGGQSSGWQSGRTNWYHGDGGGWTSRGQQWTCLFYGGASRFSTISSAISAGATVTRFAVEVDRVSGGAGGAANVIAIRATNENKPSGAPSPVGSTKTAETVSAGTKKWIDLDTGWASRLWNGDGGLILGRTSNAYDSYMLFNKSGTGRVLITLA